MGKLKIALGDLRHKTGGRNFVFMPLGISYIASYALEKIGRDNLEIKFYDDADNLCKSIDTWKPDVIGLSNYSWNSRLSGIVFQYAKEQLASVVCVSGGPEVPIEKTDAQAYLFGRPEIDFYVYFEGERAFSELIKRIIAGEKIAVLKSKAQNGIMSISPKNRELIYAEPYPRSEDLDIIPSPYLNGLMDQWFTGEYAPSIETARGCPFTCGFCFAGQSWYGKLAVFSMERVKEELTYIAKKLTRFPYILLSICDANFGMYERDEEIARHCRKLQDEYSWPNAFDVTTGKANYERILKIAEILKNKMNITCSVQSFNPETLDVIKRKNVSPEDYRDIQERIKKQGMISTTEFITPMPEETKESFFFGMKIAIDAGVKSVVPYTTMLLKGTYLSSRDCRQKYAMQTKFRILPRQFGNYVNKKCFEIEEVCVATNTMPFEDYLEIRGFALVSSFFSGEQFNVIQRHLQELEIGTYDFYYFLWKAIKSGKTCLSQSYNRYIEETCKELWDSSQTVYDHFQKEENYTKLLSGELGSNLIMKYKTELLLENCLPAFELAYSALSELLNKSGKQTVSESLEAAKRWLTLTRNVGAVLKNEAKEDLDMLIQLPYDVNAWYHDSTSPLVNFKKPVAYRIFLDTGKVKNILEQATKLYGEDLSFKINKLLINYSISNFWCQCESMVK